MFRLEFSRKQKTSVVCHQKQLWLVNDAQAVSIGKCKGKTWIAPIKLEEQSAVQINLSKEEKQVFDLLQKTSKESFKPVLLTEATEIAQAIQSKPNKSAFTLNLNVLPIHIKEFLSSIMKFVIVIASSSTDKNGKLLEYKESARYNVKVAGENSTIGEILEEAKKGIPENTYFREETYINHLYLVQLDIIDRNEKLNNNKTIKDYGLKEGTVFRLLSSVR